jgi:A/G-specific adenine glycosylase
MELGALVCSPSQPRCGACPVAAGCAARRQGRVEELPGRARAPRPTARRFVAFVIWRRGRLLVRQRPAGVVNAHLWELPNVEVPPGEAGLERAARGVLGLEPARLEPLCVVRHSITRYRMTLEAFVAQGSCGERGGGPGAPRRLEGRWLSPRQLARRPFASAHRKVLEAWNSRNFPKLPKLPKPLETARDFPKPHETPETPEPPEPHEPHEPHETARDFATPPETARDFPKPLETA